MYLEDPKKIDFEYLANTGIYSKKLLEKLRFGDFMELGKISFSLRSNINYMEPLLFAVKNELGSYNVYQYYTEILQLYTLEKRKNFMLDLVRTAPETIKNTPICQNRKFILEYINVNPIITLYMSSNLKTDSEFVKELCKKANKENLEKLIFNAEVYETIMNNPELRNDRKIMGELIANDGTAIRFASEELKNDYNFLREQSKKNESVIEYVAKNINEFGLEAIKGTRDISRENTINNGMSIINEMAETSNDPRYAKVKQKIAERGIDDACAMRWITAMVAQDDKIDAKLVKRSLDYSILTMAKLQKDLIDDGKMKVSVDNMQELISPTILNRLKEKMEKQGMQLDAELGDKLEQYTQFYEEFNKKLAEQKRKDYENKEKTAISKKEIKEVADNTVPANIVEIEEAVKAVTEPKKIEDNIRGE